MKGLTTMNLKASLAAGCGLVLALTLGSGSAMALWPTGAVRTLPGNVCKWGFKIDPHDAQLIFCPFISDSDAAYGGYNGTIYADYHVSSSGAGLSTSSYACRQSYTGSAVTCGASSTSTGTGSHDLDVLGFGDIGGTTTVYDYFYLTLSSTETIDSVYGAGYQGF
jgi:hypothetical protein